MNRKSPSIRRRTRILLLTLSTAFYPNTTRSFHTRSGFASTSLLSSRHLILRQPNLQSLRLATPLSAARMSATASDMGNAGEAALPLDSVVDKSHDMSVIDKTIFDKSIRLVAMNIPAKLCTIYMKEFKDYLMKRPRMKRIYDAEKDGVRDEERRLIVMTESMGDDLLLPNLPESLKEFNIKNDGIPEIFILRTTYDDVAVDEALRILLPAEITEIPSSFEQVGHIAHLNLREEVLQYKNLIGRVILDKNSNIRTVVNKMGSIETEFRTFPMEVIAGDADFVVTLKESNAKFNFNFKDVYWNSRLQMEHSRLVDFIMFAANSISSPNTKNEESSTLLNDVDKTTNVTNEKNVNNDKNKNDSNKKNNNNKNDNNKNKNYVSNNKNKNNIVVADMMAGVGPFAVPLAMNNITVHANDLNPESFKYLNKNMKMNHCEKFLKTENKCGRDFILSLCSEGQRFDEVIMNLPQSATDFLDVFIGLLKRTDSQGNSVFTVDTLPRIHVYAFSTAEDPIKDIVERSARTMQCSAEYMRYQSTVLPPSASNREIKNNGGKKKSDGMLIQDPCWGHIVRDVSPKKMMVCLSFRLPVQVAEADPLTFIPYKSVNEKTDSAEVAEINAERISVKRDFEGQPKVI